MKFGHSGPMFEAVIALCATLSDGPCRDSLLPGYEARSRAACAAALRADPPDLSDRVVQGAAQCVPRGRPLDVVNVAPGVFVHKGRIAIPDPENRGDVSNLGFVIGDDSVAVIDTGAARWVGEALWRAIRDRTDKPVSHIILTHMHPDHVFGASAFAGTGAVVVGHQNLPRALGDRQANYRESLTRLISAEHFMGTRAVTIDELVEGPTDIDLGNRVLQVRPWQTAHSEADVTVFDHSSGTLFVGDLIFDHHVPALDGKVIGWQAVVEELKTIKAERVIPGHGGPVLVWPGGAADQERYLDTLAGDARTAIASGDRLADAVNDIAAQESEAWMLFEEFNPRNATVAFTELEWE